MEVAAYAAREAGKVHKKYFDANVEVKKKDKSFDLITIADIEAEERIVSVIKDHYPRHNILAEERGYEKTSSEYTWIIDPLDGTNNFAHKLPIFCASVALAEKGEPIVGAIYDVSKDELFCTQKGKGAVLNGREIAVSAVEALDKALLITGFYYDRGEEMADNLGRIKLFFQRSIIGIRRFGSAALDLCNVACGRASGFWEFELNPWDFAAGKLLVEEAGGRVTGRKGETIVLQKSFMVASNGRIHNQMLEVLNL